MTDEWFREYTFRLVAEKKYISPEILKVLDHETYFTSAHGTPCSNRKLISVCGMKHLRYRHAVSGSDNGDGLE